MDVDAEKENTQAFMEVCGRLTAAGLPFYGEILGVEYHYMYLYSFSYFNATYSMSAKIPSGDKKIRRQQLVKLCVRFKLTC